MCSVPAPVICFVYALTSAAFARIYTGTDAGISIMVVVSEGAAEAAPSEK